VLGEPLLGALDFLQLECPLILSDLLRAFEYPVLILIIELIIRVRPRYQSNFYIVWSIIDKIRIGGVFALILEAFKLGS